MHRSPHGVGGSEVSAKFYGIWARGFSHGCSKRGFSIDIGDSIGEYIGLIKGDTGILGVWSIAHMRVSKRYP